MDIAIGLIKMIFIDISSSSVNMDQIDEWESYIGRIFITYPDSVIYLKGGAVIGFLLLREHRGNFDGIYNLFNDFDFTLENQNCCNHYFYNEFGEQNKIFLNGRRYKNRKDWRRKIHLCIMRSNVSNSFELLVCGKDATLEIPLTSMKLYITQNNYKKLFVLIRKVIAKNLNENDLGSLNEMNFYIPKCNENGMFVTNVLSYEISVTIKDILFNISPDIDSVNFLYYLIKNPTNLSRLHFKNIPKSDYIKSLGYKYDWLINNDLCFKLIDNLIYQLGQAVNDVYQSYKQSINVFINEINNANEWEDKIYVEEQLEETYIELSEELDKIFDGINIIRWKNHINLYLKLPTTSAIDCITDIFNFYSEILVVKSETLVENPIWALVIELIRLKSPQELS